MEDRISPNKFEAGCYAGGGPQGAAWPCRGRGEPTREAEGSGSDQPWHTGRLYCGRRVRVRSALSDSQLGALRSCYSRTPRPDAAAKLRLAQHTGLSPQVVRVWFQNKRCKDKRNQENRARRLAEELSYASYRQRTSARLMVVHSPDPPASAVPITVHESPWQQGGLFNPWIDDEDFLFTESLPSLRPSDPLGGEGPGGEGPGEEGPGGEGPGGGDDDDSLTFLSM